MWFVFSIVIAVILAVAIRPPPPNKLGGPPLELRLGGGVFVLCCFSTKYFSE